MQQLSIDNIYRDIVLLSDVERDRLYDRMRKDFYQNSEIIAYTTNGESLTIEQYRQRVNTGIEQCMKGECIDLRDLTKELGYNYADL